MKIAVHITHYDNSIDNKAENFEKKKCLKKVIDEYLKINQDITIFIHTNNKKIKSKNKKVFFIFHNLNNEKDKYKLSWKCRPLMSKQKNDYDIFIYSEDDILFSTQNFNYWIKFKDQCIKNNFNIGFMACEYDKLRQKFFCIHCPFKLKNIIFINRQKFIVHDANPYYCFWIYDKFEFNKFIKTKWWNFNWKKKNFNYFYGTAEMSAVGWHGRNMDRYKETILPVNNNRLLKGSLLYHLPNKYIKRYYTEEQHNYQYCKFSFDEIVETNKNQKKYSFLKKKLFNLFLLFNYIFFRKIKRFF